MGRPLSEEAWVTRSSLGRATVRKESVNAMAEMVFDSFENTHFSPDRFKLARMEGHWKH